AADCCAPEGAADLEGEGPPPPQETKVAAGSRAPGNRVKQHRFVIGNIPAPPIDPPFIRDILVEVFSGPVVHLSRTTGEWVAGSPLNALGVQPPFKEFHFIDADGNRAAQLKDVAGNRPEVFTYEDDCNDILPTGYRS